MTDRIIYNYFFFLISILPLSFLIGPSVSLVNILIFDLSFIFLLIYEKNWDWIKNPIIKILLILYFYLIFNSTIALDWNISFYRNFGFLRLIIFFVGVNYFFSKYQNFNKIFLVWSIIIFIVVLDIFIENIFGANILGYGEGHRRVVSFFKDEQIAGGFVYGFSMMLFGYYLLKSINQNNIFKFLVFIAAFLFLASIILTGERSNSIKILCSLVLCLFLYDQFNIKKKMIFLSTFLSIIILVIFSNDYLKNRMFNSIVYSSSNFVSSFKHDDPKDNPSGNTYAKLYRSGYEVFKNYPFFGVGNKNYRTESCLNKKYQKNIHLMINDYICMTHPHQIYFEFLSEHGLIGTLILLTLFFLIIFKHLKILVISKNYISVGSFSYLVLVFIPILPSGSFFSDYNISLFFINMSILYATSNKINIFKNN